MNKIKNYEAKNLLREAQRKLGQTRPKYMLEGGKLTLTKVPAKFKTRAASSPAALILAIPSES